MTRHSRRIAAAALAAVATIGIAATPASADVLRSNGHQPSDSKAFNCWTDDESTYCDHLPAMPAPKRFHRPAMECVGDRWSIMCEDGRVLWFGNGHEKRGEADRRAYRRYVSSLTARP